MEKKIEGRVVASYVAEGKQMATIELEGHKILPSNKKVTIIYEEIW